MRNTHYYDWFIEKRFFFKVFYYSETCLNGHLSRTDNIIISLQKYRYSNVFWPVYIGLLLLRMWTIIFRPNKLITDNNLRSTSNIIAYIYSIHKPVLHNSYTRRIFGNHYIWRVIWEVFNRKARRLFLLAESITDSRRRRIQHVWLVLNRYFNFGFPELTNNWRAHESCRSNIIVQI